MVEKVSMKPLLKVAVVFIIAQVALCAVLGFMTYLLSPKADSLAGSILYIYYPRHRQDGLRPGEGEEDGRRDLERAARIREGQEVRLSAEVGQLLVE